MKPDIFSNFKGPCPAIEKSFDAHKRFLQVSRGHNQVLHRKVSGKLRSMVVSLGIIYQLRKDSKEDQKLKKSYMILSPYRDGIAILRQS